jgi:tetratricopeptide (TPR) repeat protein
MKRGLAAYGRHEPEAALTEFKKAERLVPDANVPHRYAAEALVDLERYEDAIDEYETYLRIKPDVSDAPHVRQRMEEARTRIDATIDLSSSPPGASVFLDGNSTKSGDTPLTLKVHRGSHSIALRLSGRHDVVLSPVVKGGQSVALVANFTDPSSSGAAGRDTGRPAETSRTGTIGWVALGVGGAVLGTALVLDLFVLPSKFDTFDDKRNRDDPSAGDALSSIRHLQTFTIVGYVAGGVIAATGLVLVLWPKKTSAVKVAFGLGGASFGTTF